MEHEEQVSAEGGRRRRWSIEDKRAIAELSLEPGSNIAEIAAAFDLQANQIYAWRRVLRGAEVDSGDAPMFLPAVIEPAVSAFVAEPEIARSLLPSSAVQMALEVGGVPVVIAHGASPELARSVIDVLARLR